MVESSRHHNVYVVELGRAVLKDRRFARANPKYKPSRPCVYVGLTGLSPEERFANHKRGYKSNRYVHRYGVRLLPQLYAHLNPMRYEDAQKAEEKLACKLRRKGYAVWQK